MKIEQVTFKGAAGQAMGRNGVMQCRGASITGYPRFITIRPVTSKDTIGNCFIDIPRADIPALIKLLLEA